MVQGAAGHGLGREGAGGGQGLGADRQGEQDVGPPAVPCEARDGGHGVLSDGAGQAGVLEGYEHVLDDAGGVLHDAPEVVLVDVVPHGDDSRGVHEEAEQRGVAQHGVGGGQDAHRDDSAAVSGSIHAASSPGLSPE